MILMQRGIRRTMAETLTMDDMSVRVVSLFLDLLQRRQGR